MFCGGINKLSNAKKKRNVLPSKLRPDGHAHFASHLQPLQPVEEPLFSSMPALLGNRMIVLDGSWVNAGSTESVGI